MEVEQMLVFVQSPASESGRAKTSQFFPDDPTSSLLPEYPCSLIKMNVNPFHYFLLSLTIRSQRTPPPLSPWRARLEALVHSTFLHLWRLYKFALRILTGQAAIGRLCQRALDVHELNMYGKGIQYDNREIRDVIWRIGACSERFSLIL